MIPNSPRTTGIGGPATTSGAMCTGLAATLEELDGALVFLRRRARAERAQVSPLSGSRIELARVQSVLAGFELADHRDLPFCDTPRSAEHPQRSACKRLSVPYMFLTRTLSPAQCRRHPAIRFGSTRD